MNEHLVLLHGLNGSPKGIKGNFLKKYFPDLIAPELPNEIDLRNEIIEGLILQPSIIIGSSLGGLSALIFANRFPDLVSYLVLLAPAVGFSDPDICPEEIRQQAEKIKVPQSIPTTIIAAANDEVIPLDSIKAMVFRSEHPNLELIIQQDDHQLGQSLDVLKSTIDSVHQLLS